MNTVYQLQVMAKKLINHKTSISLIGLILVQFYFLPLTPLLFEKDVNTYVNIMYLYVASMYTLIILGIMVFHVNGITVLQDHFTLWLMVALCFLPPLYKGSYEGIYRGYMSLLGIILVMYIIANRRIIKIPQLKLLLISLLWSIGTIIVTVSLRSFLNPDHGSLPSNVPLFLINTVFFQLSFVTIIEEACFRGMIYGFFSYEWIQRKPSICNSGTIILEHSLHEDS